MFKRKPIQLKHSLREQCSLSHLTNDKNSKSKITLIHPLRGKSKGSKDSKTSLKNQQSKQKSIKKQQPYGRRSEQIKPRPQHTHKRSIDLISEYENVVRLSQKISNRQKQIKVKEQQYRSQPQSIRLQDDDLMCDQELQIRAPSPFPLTRTPPTIRSVSNVDGGMFDRYGLELSVVEQRIISEQDKEFISDKKRKTHMRMPTASTADRTNNTAKTLKEAERFSNRSTSPFELGSKPRRPTTKISINVHSLVAKSRRPDKYPSSQNTMR